MKDILAFTDKLGELTECPIRYIPEIIVALQQVYAQLEDPYDRFSIRIFEEFEVTKESPYGSHSVRIVSGKF